MTGWNGGYVTDIAYTTGYYRQQSPAHLRLACLLGGVSTAIDDHRDDLSYLEIGCGQGLGALTLAASNPGWQVTGIDFNPAHIAGARRMAAEAGLDNVFFLEADVSTLAGTAAAEKIPPAHVVSLHGVWSWVPPPVRDGIVALIADKLVAGGVVHVSYNSLPGWQGALGMQRLLREAGRPRGTRSDRRAEAGLGFVRALMGAGAHHLNSHAMVGNLIERLADKPSEYLAHEFMNESWSPCWYADVADALAPARLDYVASAALMENFPSLVLTEEQRAIHDAVDDPRLRELVKDVSIERQLRHDVYVRGPIRLDPETRDAALYDAVVALTVRADRFGYGAILPAGHATLNRAFYVPIVEALAGGPRRVGDLLALPDVEGKRDNPAELAGILVGTEQGIVVARPEAGPTPRTDRFNAMVARRFGHWRGVGMGGALASERLGAGLPSAPPDMFVRERLSAGETPADQPLWLRALGADSLDDERRESLAATIEKTVGRAPVWRNAGVL